jgi:NAD(P)-dependent dehydrogenase (short-subunit alcohol dehydrogenase family)
MTLPDDNLKDLVRHHHRASKGIGAELARPARPRNGKLVLAARNEAELTAVAEECRKLGATGVITVKGDVAIEHDCQTLVTATLIAFGRIDVLVNNAGMSMWARFEDIKDLAILDRIMRVNYMGAVFCTASPCPHLRETRRRIVGDREPGGRTGVPTRTGYSASKHAMTGFFDSCASSWTAPA